jgi:hypothetical protein
MGIPFVCLHSGFGRHDALDDRPVCAQLTNFRFCAIIRANPNGRGEVLALLRGTSQFDSQASSMGLCGDAPWALSHTGGFSGYFYFPYFPASGRCFAPGRSRLK